MLMELIERLRFWSRADRLGPDIPTSHWRLYFKSTMTALCRRKFLHFGAGAEFRAGAYAVAASKISLGSRVVIRPGSFLLADPREGGAGITIEDDVLLGSCVHIYTHDHSFRETAKPIIDQGHSASRPVRLRRGCWIGAQVVILGGVEVGENSVVGAGSVVTASVPPRCVAAGNPAKVIKRL